jgi:hypothetical protein
MSVYSMHSILWEEVGVNSDFSYHKCLCIVCILSFDRRWGLLVFIVNISHFSATMNIVTTTYLVRKAWTKWTPMKCPALGKCIKGWTLGGLYWDANWCDWCYAYGQKLIGSSLLLTFLLLIAWSHVNNLTFGLCEWDSILYDLFHYCINVNIVKLFQG